MRSTFRRHHQMTAIAITATIGVCLAIFAALQPAALAQTLPPRPTPVPTHAPRHRSGAAKTGRITGTVIDQTNGAPAPGIAVDVGGATVRTDSNGNYDRPGLAPGEYAVALALSDGQGIPVQSTITITLAEGQTVVQHLRFRSSIALENSAPAAALAAAMPATLPNTGAPARAGGWLALLGVALTLLGAGITWRRYTQR